MAINTCDGSHYTCGAKANWLTGQSSSSSIAQSRDNKLSFMLGGTEIIVSQTVRNFSISGSSEWSVDTGGFLMYNSDGGLFQCVTTSGTGSGVVSENCTYTTTMIHFLDTRYNNGIFTEVKDALDFTDTSEVCGFKETWGIGWYNKFVINACSINRTTKRYIVISGVKTVLDTKEESIPLYTVDNPLILVFPNPPSLAIPWLNCDDIKAHGFYDYHEGGPAPGGSERIEQDGGDDFYWPEWVRAMGQVNAAADAAMAAERYLTYYLNTPDPGTRNISSPGVFTDPTPCASIAVDQEERVFYSMTLDSKHYNSLTDGDLMQLFPYFPTNPKFYPVGLV